MKKSQVSLAIQLTLDPGSRELSVCPPTKEPNNTGYPSLVPLNSVVTCVALVASGISGSTAIPLSSRCVRTQYFPPCFRASELIHLQVPSFVPVVLKNAIGSCLLGGR